MVNCLLRSLRTNRRSILRMRPNTLLLRIEETIRRIIQQSKHDILNGKLGLRLTIRVCSTDFIHRRIPRLPLFPTIQIRHRSCQLEHSHLPKHSTKHSELIPTYAEHQHIFMQDVPRFINIANL